MNPRRWLEAIRDLIAERRMRLAIGRRLDLYVGRRRP